MEDNNYSIRKATVEDAQTLLNLIVEHAAYEKEEFSTTGKLEALEKCLGFRLRPFECILIENKEGEVKGYCNYLVQFDSWACAPHLYLDALYLQPEMRGQGIGIEIMNILQAEAKASDCVTVRWQTPIFNELGINFYKKLHASGTTKMFFTWDVR